MGCYGVYIRMDLTATMKRVLCYLVATASVDVFHIIRHHRCEAVQ